MRAALIREVGALPEVGDTDAPDGEAIEVVAAPLNPIDLAVSRGILATGHPPLPYVPGCEGVGRTADGRLVWTRVHREFFRDKAGEFDFRPPGKIFMTEYAKFIASRNQLLGSAGQLDDLRKSLGK